MDEIVEIKCTVSRNNVYHVPLKKWRTWHSRSRQVFNEVYSSMLLNQHLYLHPKQEKLSKENWKTTCWNAAWTAAGAAY